MQLYLVATNLFAVAALLLAVNTPRGSAGRHKLLPLYLLVISRVLALVLLLTAGPAAQPGLDALEVFSTFCVAWSLAGPLSNLAPPWPGLARLGAVSAVGLSLGPLFPNWPAPAALHSLAIAVFSPVILLRSLGEMRWSHLAPPLILALAFFLQLFNLISLSWFVGLFAYAFLMVAVHRDTLRAYHLQFTDRQQLAENLAQEAQALTLEQQRMLDLGKAINALPDLNQTFDHIARTLVKHFRVDQAAIVVLDAKKAGQARLATFFSPEQTFLVTDRDQNAFLLENCAPLQLAFERRTPMQWPQAQINGLEKVYGLWHEDRIGPTLIQPLSLHGQAVGALVLGNPASRRAIPDSDARLCHDLAGQIAALVEYGRRYQNLENQAEQLAATVQKQMRPAPPTAPPDRSAEIEAYLAIFHAISDGVVLSDATGRVRWLNQAAEHILGQTRQELIGQSIARVYGEIDSGEPIEDLMVAFSRRNQPLPTFIEDENRAIQGRLIPWRNQDYEWMGIITVFRDVTREVKADRARNDFIAALSRELRAPLTTVKGYSELITNGLMQHYSPEQLRVQRIIQNSSERMVTVLDNAIQITVQNRHKYLPRFEEIKPAKIIDDTLRELAPTITLRELSLQREISDNLPAIAADPRHFRRILDNLLSNACKFTPPGGMITVRAWGASEREGNKYLPRLQLAIADNGIGVPPTETKRIFDPFYQVYNHSADEQSGMGMGLAVVKELVQLHSGRVWVDSTPGKGSVFNVVLPVTQDY